MAFTGSTAGLAAGAQTNDTVLTWALEATYKQSPTGPYQQGRFTAETLSRSQSTSRPSEINTIKEVSQSIVTQVTASGRISGALSTGTFDDFLSGVLGNDFADTIQIIVDSAATDAVTGKVTLKAADHSGRDIIALPAAALANFPDAGVVRIVDTTQSIDTYLKYILNNRTTPALEFEAGSLPFTDGYTLPDKSTITSASIINGNIDKTYTIRKSILGAWLMYPGSLINQMQLTFTQGQFAQVEADVISANEVMSPTNIASAELPAPSGNIHNTVDNFLGCSLLDKSPAGCITAASITLARNGSKADYGTGHADACGIITGQFEASGSVSFYYRTEDEYQAALAGRQGPVVIKSVDSAGNGYAFVFLNAALRNPQLQTESVNKTYELKLDIEGNPTSSGATFAIFRITSGS